MNLSMGSSDTPDLEKLKKLVDEVGDLQSKLILLVGKKGKTRLMHLLAERLQTRPFDVGAKLAHQLAATPAVERGFSTNRLLRDVTDSARGKELPLLLDNLEVLFEPSLKINPLELIKQLAHSRRVVAVWPGEMRDDRLVYARMGHPEHREYGCDGVVVFEIHQSEKET